MEIISAIFSKFSWQKSWDSIRIVSLGVFCFFCIFILPIKLHSYLLSGNVPNGSWQIFRLNYTYITQVLNLKDNDVIGCRHPNNFVHVFLPHCYFFVLYSARYGAGHWLWFAISVRWHRKCDELEIVSIFMCMCICISCFCWPNSCLRNVCGFPEIHHIFRHYTSNINRTLQSIRTRNREGEKERKKRTEKDRNIQWIYIALLVRQQ